eukprot:gene9572-10561_t
MASKKKDAAIKGSLPNWPMMTLGKMTGGESLTAEQQSKAQSGYRPHQIGGYEG